MPHSCLVVGSDGETLRALCDFVIEGLRKGEVVAAIVEKTKVIPLLAALQRREPELIEGAVKDAQLFIRTPEETYLLNGSFSPPKMISLMRGAVADAQKRGFKRFRGAGVASWAAERAEYIQQILEYEEMVNQLVKGRADISFLCIYDEAMFRPKMIEEVLRVHGQKQ